MCWLLVVTLTTLAICVTGEPTQNIECEDCVGQECGFDGFADVVFAVDISGSMKQYGRYEAEKSFVKSVISKLDLGDDKVKTAGVPFNRRIRPGWSFQDSASTNPGEICSAVDSFSRARGDTHTEAGITKALKYFENHGRAGACPVLVLITGGGSDSPTKVFHAGNRLRSSGARVCLVSIGSRNANKVNEFTFLVGGKGEQIPNNSGNRNDLSPMVDDTVACISRCSMQQPTPAPQREGDGCNGTSFFLSEVDGFGAYGSNHIMDGDGQIQTIGGVAEYGAFSAVWNTKDKIIFSMFGVNQGSLSSYDLSNGIFAEFAPLGDYYLPMAMACDGEHVFVVAHDTSSTGDSFMEIIAMGLDGEDPKVITTGFGGIVISMAADPVQKKLYYADVFVPIITTVDYTSLDLVQTQIRDLELVVATGMFFDIIGRQLYVLTVNAEIYRSPVDVDSFAFELIVSPFGFNFALNLALCDGNIYYNDVEGGVGNIYKIRIPSEGEVVDGVNRRIANVAPQTPFKQMWAFAPYPSDLNAGQ